jgi:spermidine synthase
VRQTLFSEQSEFQHVDVIETVPFGRMLLNDGLVMVTERDEHIYHEMMVHVPLLTHPNPRKVLVIGGGDGGTVREVLKHSSVEKVHLVEIDEAVVRACRLHIPQTAACLDDERVVVNIEDGVSFTAKSKEKFDVVLVDSTDPIGPATPLFGEDFYSSVYTCLNDEGIVVAQGESAFYEGEMQSKILTILASQFAATYIYNYTNMTYPGSLWSFVVGTKGLCPLRDFDERRFSRLSLNTRYYNPSIHRASFALPEFMRDKFDSLLTGIQA